MIYMIHPKHGAHNALSGEVEAMKLNGWKLGTPAEFVAMTKPKAVEVKEVVEVKDSPKGKK